VKTNLFLGDICQVPADVICTSTNPHLDLMIGTGGAVRSAGGWGIQEECYRIIRERGNVPERTFLDPGEAVMTSAGNLPYAAVIHCVAIDSFHNSTAEIIGECVSNALAEFAKLPDTASLAFPVFASGNGRFDFAASLTEICRALKEHWPAQLEQAWIVVHEDHRRKDAEMILREAFGEFSVAQP
jgi:O-acetyl-ADP-ribose deacetylase (regulator of RNase III)